MKSGLGEIADIVRTSETPGAVSRRLRAWSKSKSSAVYAPLAKALFVPAVMSDMAGQLMVYGREVDRVKFDAADEVTAFLDLPWEEALRGWRARGLMSPEEFAKMLGDYEQRSEKARKLMLDQVQVLVRARLDDAISNGTSFKEFAQQIQEGTAKLGLSAQDPQYLSTVYRTNIQAAYGAGRFRAITDPDVIDARPYVQYRTVGDAVVCPRCDALDGIKHSACYSAHGDAYHDIAPPNHWNDRCSLVTLSREEAKGLKVLDEPPEAGAPAPGFDGPPVAKLKT